MRIDGEWLLCDDGVTRPVVRAEILSADSGWVSAEFLVDTGADQTVFSAPTLAKLALPSSVSNVRVTGLGGIANSVAVATQIRLSRDGGGRVLFRGAYAAVTELEALDVSVLGRDIMGLFAVIVDHPGSTVCLLGQQHSYRIDRIVH